MGKVAEIKETLTSRTPQGCRCDLERIAHQAYHRVQWSSGLVRRYHREKALIPAHLAERVDHLYRLFLAPMTLWPFNIKVALESVLDAIKSRRKLDAATELLFQVLPPVPDESTVDAVIAHEHDVQSGRYEHLVPASAAKFVASERALSKNKGFQTDWKKIADCFDVSRHADRKGVIRRTMVPERNLRADFDPDWKTKAGRFRAVFDTFCAKWNLYGMQNGKPLLQKLSVNLTPFGTMIVIPAYWSFDPKRDVDWGSITKLHKARGQHRQGPALAEGAEQRRADAAKLVELEAEANERKLRGATRHEFLCKGLGWDLGTDPKRISRLRKLLS